MQRERGEEEQKKAEKSSVYMYNVNFSRIRGLCRLFHYYFLFIFLISKETKLLCMEPINCHANDSSRQIDAYKREAKSHIHAKTNEKKKTIKSFAVTQTHIDEPMYK